MKPFDNFPESNSPAVVARLDDGTFRVRQGTNVIAVSAEQAGDLVDELQRLRFPPRKSRDLGSV